MPISSPPLTYQLDRVGTSGVGVGPQLAIVSPSGDALPCGVVGHIAVQGPPNFKRYENMPVSSSAEHCSDIWENLVFRICASLQLLTILRL